jgi:mannose/fructose/N-acetylgalactosamine-specific phosphotransferase system component IIC
MTEDMAIALAWGIAAIALFSFLSIAAWTSARQRERDAYYKSEAIKKLAEMQGATPEPVLQVLREAMGSWKSSPSPANMGPFQARAYYRAETIKKIADMQGGADAVLTVLREEEKIGARRTREGLKLAGFITCAVGLGLLIALRAIVTDLPVYLAGFIPLFVGIALLAYGYTHAAKDLT